MSFPGSGELFQKKTLPELKIEIKKTIRETKAGRPFREENLNVFILFLSDIFSFCCRLYAFPTVYNIKSNRPYPDLPC